MATANIIGGAIPFGPGGNPLAGAAGGVNGLAQQYGTSYDSALKQNQALYGNILSGYQQTAQKQTDAQNQIQSGYGDLTGQVLGGIQGIGASQSQAINDAYAQQSGATAQGLISRGLGNTTVQDSMQRGLMLDKQKAGVALANQMAQLTAGYQSNLGMAGLNQQNMSNMQNTALAGQQLNWMNSVTAQYPHAQDYYGLYQQQGQWQQAQADRDLAAKLAQQGRGTVPSATVGAPVPNRSFGSGSGGGGGGLMTASGPQGSLMSPYASGPNGVTGGPQSWQLNNPTPYGATIGNASEWNNFDTGSAAAFSPYDYATNNANDYANGSTDGGNGYDYATNNAADYASQDDSWF